MSPDQELDIRVETLAGNTVLVLRGELSARTVPRARDATVKALLSEGRVVVDVSGLRLTRDYYAFVFPTAQALAGGWPTVKLVLCGAGQEFAVALTAGCVDAYVPVLADRDEALRWLDQRPRRNRARRQFSPEPAAVPRSAEFVAEVCRAWGLPAGLVQVANVVCRELVANAVRHARTTAEVVLQWTENGVLLSVRDEAPGRLLTAENGGDSASSHGLGLVGALTESWGVRPHPTGKTVWARLWDEPAVAP